MYYTVPTDLRMVTTVTPNGITVLSICTTPYLQIYGWLLFSNLLRIVKNLFLTFNIFAQNRCRKRYTIGAVPHRAPSVCQIVAKNTNNHTMGMFPLCTNALRPYPQGQGFLGLQTRPTMLSFGSRGIRSETGGVRGV